MRSTDTAFIQWLRTTPNLWSADLFTVTLTAEVSNPSAPTGTVWRWTTADRDISHGGTTWSAAGPRIARSSWSSKAQLEVPEMTVTIDSAASELLGDVPVNAFVNNGGFDGTRIRLERALTPTASTAAFGTILLFEGRVSTATAGRMRASLTVKGDLLLLDQQMPRNLYQANCLHTLYDSGCAVLRSRYTWTNSVGQGSIVGTIVPATPLTSLAADGAGHALDPQAFAQGAVSFTGGMNAGVVRSIKVVSGGNLGLAYPLPHAPAVGDPFQITYGCDHTAATCKARFNNLANIRAFPYIPAAETAT
ncbi:DUF2163 domain-containing protein [Nitrospirillum iridis]|uniref:Putative phage protein (TIGR02218 family) n=1 Tax=Nitrospirillum iridis TaxID=765888 RepID=A0A7X0AX88_9PROT|nr:DUF2163 domain-containing protein [Nitrospirillum iridis]MBB6251705.1 putative phage protein (TIGR02218 family) [Nitrospirillum iridis]